MNSSTDSCASSPPKDWMTSLLISMIAQKPGTYCFFCGDNFFRTRQDILLTLQSKGVAIHRATVSSIKAADREIFLYPRSAVCDDLITWITRLCEPITILSDGVELPAIDKPYVTVIRATAELSGSGD